MKPIFSWEVALDAQMMTVWQHELESEVINLYLAQARQNNPYRNHLSTREVITFNSIAANLPS